MELKRIGIEQKEAIKKLFVSVFTIEPWNDDWSDEKQLDCYIDDLIGQGYSLTYGLYDGDELIGMSLGYIKHWYTGTEYYIDELCIRTDRQGAGAGTIFLSEIEKAIKELGLKQIFLQTGLTLFNSLLTSVKHQKPILAPSSPTVEGVG